MPPTADTAHSSQVSLIYIAQNHNFVAKGFKICRAYLSLNPWSEKENVYFNRKKKKEISVSATEEGSLFKENQTCKICCVHRVDWNNNSKSIKNQNDSVCLACVYLCMSSCFFSDVKLVLCMCPPAVVRPLPTVEPVRVSWS